MWELILTKDKNVNISLSTVRSLHDSTVKKLKFRPCLGRASYTGQDEKCWLQLASCSSDYSVRIMNVNLTEIRKQAIPVHFTSTGLPMAWEGSTCGVLIGICTLAVRRSSTSPILGTATEPTQSVIFKTWCLLWWVYKQYIITPMLESLSANFDNIDNIALPSSQLVSLSAMKDVIHYYEKMCRTALWVRERYLDSLSEMPIHIYLHCIGLTETLIYIHVHMNSQNCYCLGILNCLNGSFAMLKCYYKHNWFHLYNVYDKELIKSWINKYLTKQIYIFHILSTKHLFYFIPWWI